MVGLATSMYMLKSGELGLASYGIHWFDSPIGLRRSDKLCKVRGYVISVVHRMGG